MATVRKTSRGKESMKASPAVCVVGLGYVGLTLALTLAECGRRVIGVDTGTAVVEAMARKEPHFYEEGLAPLLKKHLGKGFIFRTDIPQDESITTFIIAVGVSMLKNGNPDYRDFTRALKEVGRRLAKGSCVILRSTLPVGASREIALPLLERSSGLAAGQDFSLAFAPERTIEGTALKELTTLPQVIGGLDEASVARAKKAFAFAPSIIIAKSLEEAEMVKLVNNTYRDVAFAFANELALICNVFNIDAASVITAACTDYPRTKIPRPSPGVGGYCLTKDPYILVESATRKGYRPRLPSSARSINKDMPRFLANKVQHFLSVHEIRRPVRVGILGLAFKGNPPTSDIRFSPTLDLIAFLSGLPDAKIVVHDPVVHDSAFRAQGIVRATTIEACFDKSDIVIAMLDHPLYKKQPYHTLVKRMRAPGIFVDTWSMCDDTMRLKVCDEKNRHYSTISYDSYCE